MRSQSAAHNLAVASTRLLSLLHKAGDMVDEFISFPRLRYSTDLNAVTGLIIAESIAILGDSLMNATGHIWEHLHDDIKRFEHSRVRKRLRFCEPATLSLKRMEQQGWCKSTRMMMHRLVDSTGLAYTGMLKRAETRASHNTCNTTHCKSMQIEGEVYRPKHVSEDCVCSTIMLSSIQVSSIIMSGKRPCIRYSPQLDKLELIASGHGYVALSHVWAHGMGNPAANGLSTCQLERLQCLATAVYQRRYASALGDIDAGSAHPEPGFWIDTLCIPLEKSTVRRTSSLSWT